MKSPNRVSNFVEFTVNKQTTKEDIDDIFEELFKVSDGNGDLNVLANYQDIPNITAVLPTVKMISNKLKSISKLNKYAIMSDSKVLHYFVPVLDVIMIGKDIKLFSSGDREVAIDWLSQPSVENTVNVHILEVVGSNAIALNIEGKLSKVDYEAIDLVFERVLLSHKTINLAFDIRNLSGITFMGFIENVKSELKYFNRISKVAVVTKEEHNLLESISDLLTPGINFKIFSGDDKNEAFEFVLV